MANKVLFRSIEIENFRGFQEAQRLDLNGSVVIAIGPNGTGKTSFFDAIQWLLLGKLPRLGDRANRRSLDYVVNRWCESKLATVSAELWIDGHSVFLRRYGDANESHLELQDAAGVAQGDEAQHRLGSHFLLRSGISLDEAMMTSGILQQDAFRAVMEGDPKNRYAHLTRLLGLEELPTYETEARSRADASAKSAKDLRSKLDEAEIELRASSQKLQQLIKDLSESPSTEQVYETASIALDSISAMLSVTGGFPLDVREMSRLESAARQLRQQAESLLSEGRQVIADESGIDLSISSHIEATTSRVLQLTQQLSEATSASRTSQLALREEERIVGRLVDLASRALPLLTDHCPVCGQNIDQDQVRRKLDAMVTGEGQFLQSLSAEAEEAEQRLTSVREELDQAERSLAGLRAEEGRLQRHYRDKEAWLAKCAVLATGIGPITLVSAKDLSNGAAAALQAVGRAAALVEHVTRDAAIALGRSQISSSIDEERARNESLMANVLRLRQSVSESSQRAEEDRGVAHATTRAITKLTTQRFELLAPLVANIYSRLDPHPAFTRLDYELGVYYQRAVADPVVIDEEMNVRADPLLIFSASQANVTALTFFLAMSWTAGSHALPFILLDDPLQAMDDINALGFADLCRHIRTERQLVVSTHDRRLGNLLERKLAPRVAGERSLVLRFVGWDRSGPQIEQELIDPQVDAANRLMLIEAA